MDYPCARPFRIVQRARRRPFLPSLETRAGAVFFQVLVADGPSTPSASFLLMREAQIDRDSHTRVAVTSAAARQLATAGAIQSVCRSWRIRRRRSTLRKVGNGQGYVDEAGRNGFELVRVRPVWRGTRPLIMGTMTAAANERRKHERSLSPTPRWMCGVFIDLLGGTSERDLGLRQNAALAWSQRSFSARHPGRITAIRRGNWLIGDVALV